jgi:nitrite reductase (NADH) small subunit
MSWIKITKAVNIPEREGRTLEIGSRSIALFNLGKRFVAVENRCPHGGGPLADGIVGGTTVTCPLHNWRVCLDSGQVVKPCSYREYRIKTFDVKVEDGTILLSLGQQEDAAQAA